MPAGTLIVGDVEIVALLDIDTVIPLEEAFDRGDPPPGGMETLGERYPYDFTSDSWRFRVHCFLVRTPFGMALIDTGVGSIDSACGRWLRAAGTLPGQLEAIGVAPSAVDHVILTHAHSDHIGWNTVPMADGFVPLFPNARYHLHEADVVWARSSDDEDDVREFAEAIAPLEASGQLDTSIEDREVLRGLALRHAPGHTPGHRVVLLELDGDRVLFAGDLLHFTFQLNDADFRSPADRDPEEGIGSRRAWLALVEAEGMTLATTHVPPTPFGRLVRERGIVHLRPR